MSIAIAVSGEDEASALAAVLHDQGHTAEIVCACDPGALFPMPTRVVAVQSDIDPAAALALRGIIRLAARQRGTGA